MTTPLPLKHVAQLNPETLSDDTDPNLEFRYIDIGAVGRGALLEPPQPMTYDAAPSRARRRIRVGDTILSTVRTYLRACWTLRADEGDLVASTGFVVVRPSASIDSRYLGWLVQSDVVVEEVVARSVGVSYPAVSPSEIGNIKVDCPPIHEQRAVADYLDRETARIDALIAAKRRLVVALDERRKAWLHLQLRACQEHAGLVPLKSVARWVEGPGILADDFRDEGVPLLRIRNLVGDTIDLAGCDYVPETLVERRWRHLCVRAGELLVSGSARSGSPVVVPAKAHGAVPYTGLIRIWSTTDRLSRAFLRLFLASPAFEAQIDRLKTGVGLQHWGPYHLSQIKLPVPTYEEQTALADAFSNYERVEHSILGLHEHQIALLGEHRQALITAAVTGQLDITKPSEAVPA